MEAWINIPAELNDMSNLREPEEPYREQGCPDHHWQESLFRYRDTIILLQFAVVAWFERDHDSAADQNADDECNIRQRCDGFVDTAIFREYNWVGFQEYCEYISLISDCQNES